ncbi:hypothetical protein WJX73_003773 [Symbiochloris irregularis]|uniref:Uncharacterized protein n=1 Tax=Symbiochloris irregularis TaxID=706552 RepID=A0AAW1PR17_9CHLO
MKSLRSDNMVSSFSRPCSICEAGTSAAPDQLQSPAQGKPNGHSLIPRIIHQTYRSHDLPPRLVAYMQTWAEMNPGWEIRFYTDAACKRMIEQEFPEYLKAYEALPANVERADFFRYMVILRYGGVHADVDTQAIRPLDDLIQENDTLLACWENEFATPWEAKWQACVRQRQVLQCGDSVDCDSSTWAATGS